MTPSLARLNVKNEMYPQSRHINTSSMNVRLNTGLRAPTGYRGGQISSQLLQSKALKLRERPVTQQGVTGLKSQIAGPKRKVFDKSYYVQAFKKKNERLTQEIAKLRQQKEKRNEEEAVRSKLEERKTLLHSEVRSLEAKLADLNLAMDKHRAGTQKGDLVGVTRSTFESRSSSRTKG